MSMAVLRARAEEGGEPVVCIGGERFVPDVSGALWWPAEATVIVADLHLEKGSAFARRRQFLPPYDSRTTLSTLEHVASRRRARAIMLLGDTFHDDFGFARLGQYEREALERLSIAYKLLFVAGNHDSRPPASLPGAFYPDISTNQLIFQHQPPQSVAPGPFIAGHLHPVARVRTRAGVVRRRCFIASEAGIVLPAFGAYAGGLNVLDRAFQCVRRSESPILFVLGQEILCPVAMDNVVADIMSDRRSGTT